MISRDEAQNNYTVFRRLVNHNSKIYSWDYASDGTLLDTDCPSIYINQIFEKSACFPDTVEHFRTYQNPIILSTQPGFLWGAVYDGTSDASSFHVIGPCLGSRISDDEINAAVRELVPNMEARKGFREILRDCSVLAVNVFEEYILLLHRCFHEEPIAFADITLETRHYDRKVLADVPLSDNHRQSYRADRTIFDCVREGDLNYKEVFNYAGATASGMHILTDNPTDQAIVTIAGFMALCTRAAIEGGLSAESAYTLRDRYAHALLSTKSVTEIAAISYSMYDSFVRAVHETKEYPGTSAVIRDCAAYIATHPEDDLSLPALAERFGYAHYYLSRKFKAEAGESISSYINRWRIRRAELLLTSTDLSIARIAEMLHYSSANYFSDTFRKIAGVSPVKYRQAHQ